CPCTRRREPRGRARPGDVAPAELDPRSDPNDSRRSAPTLLLRLGTGCMSSVPFQARPQVSADHYRPSHYLTPRRMLSIGHQFELVVRHFPGSSVLEIGGGGGLTRDLLRQEGHRVIPFDFDPALHPEVV